MFNTAGYYVVFVAEQMQVKKEIRAQINSGYMNGSLTTTITINRSELSKITFYEDGQEMRYNDNMYDIAKTTEAKNAITYYCINDSKESSLFAQLDKHISTHVAANKPLKDNGSKTSLDNVIKIYFSTKNSFTFDQIGTVVHFTPVHTVCLSAQKQNSTPPPPEFC